MAAFTLKWIENKFLVSKNAITLALKIGLWELK